MNGREEINKKTLISSQNILIHMSPIGPHHLRDTKTNINCCKQVFKMRNTKLVLELKRPYCRTPIKPMQVHKNAAKYARKPKHVRKKDEI